jgi:hypothetical protein
MADCLSDEHDEPCQGGICVTCGVDIACAAAECGECADQRRYG